MDGETERRRDARKEIKQVLMVKNCVINWSILVLCEHSISIRPHTMKTALEVDDAK